MFVGKARSLLLSGACERCFIHLGSSLTSKHETRLERLARDKHSSLFQKFVTYGRKKISKIGTKAQCYRTFFVRNLQIFVISSSVCPWQAIQAKSNKHSSLVQKIVTYGRKFFYKIVTRGQCYKTFFVHELRIFILDWKSLPRANTVA
jgi:hypothetical protein